MEIQNLQQTPYKWMLISVVLLISLIFYSSRSGTYRISDSLAFDHVCDPCFSVLADVIETEEEESSVTLCQIRVQFAGSDGYDDRALLSLLAKLKHQDFFIGQPVWGPADTLLYLCEHRLKSGLKQSKIDKELNKVMKNSPVLSGRLAWTCA
jgi:hypothetical protein